MQVYRVSDMELVRVLPSAEDEVNVACFHPLVGGGLVYGTKVSNIIVCIFLGICSFTFASKKTLCVNAGRQA